MTRTSLPLDGTTLALHIAGEKFFGDRDPDKWALIAAAINAGGDYLSLINQTASAVTPEQFGAVGNTQIFQATTTHAAGTTLVWPSPVFKAGDVSKKLVLTEAGTAPATGDVSSVPVTAAGTGYTSVPTASIAGGGTGAVIQTQMKLLSATINSAGTGYTNGTYSFPISGGLGVVAVLNVTVAGGVVSAVNSVSTAGQYTVLPTLTGAGHTFVPAAGGSNATFNLVFGVDSIVVCNCGSGYTPGSTTASLSGGGGAGATLGTVSVTPTIPALVTTITGFNSPTSVNIADPIVSTATKFRQLSFGTDDTAAFTSALALASAVILDGTKNYGLTAQLGLPDDGRNFLMTGRGKPRLVALAAMTNLVYKGTVNGLSAIENVIVEGNTVVTHPVNLESSHGTRIEATQILNAAAGGSNLVIGKSDFSTTSYENVIGDSVRIANDIGYSSPKDLPQYCIENYGSDNHIGKVKLKNAYQACIYNGGSDNHHNAPHGFGFPQTLAPQFIFQDAGQGTWINPICDTWAFQGAGFYRSATSPQWPSIVSGAQYEFGGQPTAGTNCLRVATGSRVVAQGATVPTGQTSGFGIFQPVDIVSIVAPRSPWTMVYSYPSAIYEASLGVAATTTTATNSAGSFALNAHDTSTAGGNALGPGAVDLALTRSNPAQVASGTGSFVAGTSVTASASNSVAIGINSSATGAVSHARGSNATDRGSNSKDVWAGSRFSVGGDQQDARTIFWVATSSTSAARLTTSGGGTGAFEVGALGANSFWLIRGFLLGRKSDGTSACFKLAEIPVKLGATANTITFDGTPTFTLVGTNPASVALPTCTADTTHGSPNFSVIPPDTGAWHWMMVMYSTEIA